MARRSCDAAGFLAALRSAVANLEAHVDEVNALNVFPVPDGDTGTNMLATVRAALAEAEAAATDRDVPVERVAAAASYGALMAARGNSGVITSQILAGLGRAMAGRRRFSALDLANALDEGAKTAYRAVARPVEGTILTVVRESAAAAIAAAERENEVVGMLAATVDAAEKSVARTPSLLPVLREARVVDSGGQGLLRLFQGALAAARGEPLGTVAVGAAPRPAPAARPAHEAPGEGAFGWETVYLLRARPGQELDVAAIQADLEAMGDSVLVAGDPRLVKVHVHNDRPDRIIAYGLDRGLLSRITVENMDEQAHDVHEARVAGFAGRSSDEDGAAPAPAAHGTAVAADPGQAGAPAGPLTRLPIGLVAVAPSDGLAALLGDVAAPFREHGAFRVVRGGQSANPSTGELLEAVRGTAADELIVLPNNPNVVLAARQVANMADRPVHVVPTRNCAEAVAAILELTPGRSAHENAAEMTAASRRVQSFQVTEAVRDAIVSGRKVKKGQAIALDPDDGLLAAEAEPGRAVLAALARLDPGYGLVTLYYGEQATLADAEGLARAVREAAPGVEVEVVHGGQPHYRFLVAAE